MTKDYPPYLDYPKPKSTSTPIKTNYDEIMRMTVEELAEFISGKGRTFGEEYEGYMSALDWLKSPVEGDT